MDCQPAAVNRRQLGHSAEELACAFLIAQGLHIELRNFRQRVGELDVVARQDDVLVIAEVRTRTSEQFGGAAASISHRKRQRLVRTAKLLLQRRGDLCGLRVRFDVLIVHRAGHTDARVEWIQHAFDAAG